MKNIIFIFSISLVFSNLQAQCDTPILETISFTNGTEVQTSYCGTVNDRGQRDGQGRLEYFNYEVLYKKGNWKNDRLNGEGKTVFTNGQVFEGVYKSGKLEKGFSKTFENNYSKKNKTLRDSTIVIEKKKLLRDLKRVDSIQKIYLEVIKTESEKESVILSNGDMTVSQEKTSTREYELLQEEMKIRNELTALDEKQINESDFYDVLSSFEDTGGIKKVSIYLRYPILFPLIAFGLMILTFVVYKTFYFIKEYE